MENQVITINLTQEQTKLLQSIMWDAIIEFESGSEINPKKEFDIRKVAREIWEQTQTQLNK